MLKHLQSREDWNEKSLGAKGFTLVELLVVIVILGILAAVVVFAVSGISDRAQINACKSEIRTVRTALEAYRADFPENPNPGLNALIGTGQGQYLTDTPEYVEITAGGVVQKNSSAPGGC